MSRPFKLRTPLEDSLFNWQQAREAKKAKKARQSDIPDERKYGTQYERSQEQIEGAKRIAARAFQND